MRRAWSRASAGMRASKIARPTSAAIMTGRRRRRSIHTPANNPMRRNGANWAAPRMPICAGVALSVSAAVSGRARVVTCDPNSETVCAAHRRMKSRWRQSDAAVVSSATGPCPPVVSVRGIVHPLGAQPRSYPPGSCPRVHRPGSPIGARVRRHDGPWGTGVWLHRGSLPHRLAGIAALLIRANQSLDWLALRMPLASTDD
jgi:hypothetical protein